jgi:quercetin dioxygenase-like cupin family protein
MADNATKVPRKPIANVKSAIITHRDEAPVTKGRRAFFEYRDFGLSGPTEGALSAQLITGRGGGETTGWHYHTCEWQWVYQLKGEVELQFEDGTTKVLRAGCSALLPGGVKHNEVRMSDEIECVEIFCPAEFGTINCEPPEAFR